MTRTQSSDLFENGNPTSTAHLPLPLLLHHQHAHLQVKIHPTNYTTPWPSQAKRLLDPIHSVRVWCWKKPPLAPKSQYSPSPPKTPIKSMAVWQSSNVLQDLPMDIVTIYNICRICQLPSVEPSNPLLSPCRCLGSIRFVHNPCLMVHINLLISIMSIVLGNHTCIFRESVAIVEKKNLFWANGEIFLALSLIWIVYC